VREAAMTSVITEPCIRCKYTDCAEVSVKRKYLER
jgi:hypothetical protein